MRDLPISWRRLSVASAIVFTTLVVLGCGGTGLPSKSSAERAEGALLVRRDLPEGWEKAAVIRVKGPCRANPFRGAAGSSGSHFLAQTADIQQQVGEFSTVEAADRAYTRLSSPRQLACFRHIAERGMELHTRQKFLKRLVRVPRGSIAKGVRSTRIVGALESPIGPVNVYVDRVRSKIGQMVMDLKITAGLEPLSDKFYRTVVAKALKHLSDEASENSS